MSYPGCATPTVLQDLKHKHHITSDLWPHAPLYTAKLIKLRPTFICCQCFCVLYSYRISRGWAASHRDCCNLWPYFTLRGRAQKSRGHTHDMLTFRGIDGIFLWWQIGLALYPGSTQLLDWASFETKCSEAVRAIWWSNLFGTNFIRCYESFNSCCSFASSVTDMNTLTIYLQLYSSSRQC